MSFANKGKKIIAFLMAIVFIFSLASCGKKDESTKEAEMKKAEANAQEVLGKIIFSDEATTAIVNSVTLITKNKNFPDVSVAWSSSEEDVISNTGVVTRPQADDERIEVIADKNVVKVTLTATISSKYSYTEGGENKTGNITPLTKTYTFTVLALDSSTKTGTIAEVKAAAWKYVYDENSVPKTLTSNNSVVFPVQVTGIVTAKLQADGATKGFAIHDGTEGIYVFGDSTSINVGDAVKVTGGVYSYYGSLQVGSDVTVEKAEKGDLKIGDYTAYTPDQWETAQKENADKTLPDNVIGYLGGKLIKVTGFLNKVEAAPGGSSDKYSITDAETGETCWIYYKSYNADMEADLTANNGKYVEISGVSYGRDSRLGKNEILWDGTIAVKTAPTTSDADKVKLELAAITLNGTYMADFALSQKGTWTVVSGTGIAIDGNTAKVTRKENAQTVVLKVTVTVGEATDSKEFTINIPGTKITLTSFEDAVELAGTTKNEYTKEKYYLKGEITEIQHATYGNLLIKDEAGNTFSIYGSYSADGQTRFDKLEKQPEVGDTIIIWGVLGYYNAPQMKSGWIIEITPAAATPDRILSKVVLAPTAASDFELDSTVTWTVKSGSGIVIEGNTAKVTLADAEQTVVLTATAKVGDATATKDFTVKISAKATANSVIYDFSKLQGSTTAYTAETLAATLVKYITNGTNVVDQITECTKIYAAVKGQGVHSFGIKASSSSADGILTLKLSKKVKAVKMTCYAWNDASPVSFTINGGTAQTVQGADAVEVSVTFETATNELAFVFDGRVTFTKLELVLA